MACILSMSTPDVLIQVTDRRLTWPDGQIFNDYTNKVTIFNGRMAVSYAGLSKVLGQKTDEWLVQILANPTIRTLADAVYTIQDRATTAFRDWARTPKEKARHHLMFGGIAWARQPGRESLRVLICFVSNCHDEHGALQAEARDDFRVHHRILEPGDTHGFFSIGAALSTEERHRLKERTRTATSLDDLTAGLVEAVREVAARDGTVSKNVLAVTIPRAVVEREWRDVMLLAGPPLTLNALGSVYFPENWQAPIQYCPHFVYAGSGVSSVRRGRDDAEPHRKLTSSEALSTRGRRYSASHTVSS
jgi:hypothetical protein